MIAGVDDGAGATRSVGAIDIGTNTVLLLIAGYREGQLVPLLERANITRLGQGVDRTRALDPSAIERTLSALQDFAALLQAHGVTEFEVVGTSALRDAQGADVFLDRAERILGRRPQVISGTLEAALTFEGALAGLPLSGKVTVFDVGGGSTEVISGVAGPAPDITSSISLDLGSVRLFERHVRTDPISPVELATVRTEVETLLASVPRPESGAVLVGVAGTVTTLAAIELSMDTYDADRVHGRALSREAVFALSERLAALALHSRLGLAGLEPKRADVIVAGAEIVRGAMVWSGASKLIVSDRGVRWGVAQRLARGIALNATQREPA